MSTPKETGNLLPIKGPKVNLSYGSDGMDYNLRDVFNMHVASRGLTYTEWVSIKSDGSLSYESLSKVEVWTVIAFHTSGDRKNLAALIETEDNTLLYFQFWDKRGTVCLAAHNQKDADSSVALLHKIIPSPVLARDKEAVPIDFWSLGPRGAVSRDKRIQPLMWNEIRRNYPEDTRAQIEALSAVRPPLTGGRLILWHGLPGTGKSSAIRSLVFDWLPWCDSAVVVDPENFFGSADYMLSVLLDKSVFNNYAEDDDEDDEDSPDLILQGKERWNLLVVEDADEFINADAKARTGQGLSRLLNMADGLIGQGLNFMILITTNEKIQNIHSAVGREGRCFAKTEFSAFSRTEAEDWLGDSAIELKGSKETEFTLAQLFDKQREQQQIKTAVEDISHGVYL